MGISERKGKEKKQMQNRILDAAMRLFLSKGFERTTMRAIAAKIEYSPATIYLYYKDRNEILYALHERGFEKLYKQQQTIAGIKDPWERLEKRAGIYVSFGLKNPEYYDLMFIMRGPAKKIKEKDKWETGLRSYELLKENVMECMEAGYLIKTDPDVAAFAFWSFTHGIVSLVIRNRCIMFPKEQMDAIIKEALAFKMKSFNLKAS